MALITGKWQWIDYPRFTNKSTIEQSINFNYAGKQYTKIRFYYHNEVDIQYIDSAGSATTIYNDDEGLWFTDIRSLDFGNTNQDVKDEFFTQFSANATQSIEPTIEGNYTQTVKTADGLLKIYPKTKAKNVMLDSSAAGITAEDVQSGIKELNDKIASAEAAAVKPNGTYPEMTVGNAIRLNYSVIASAGTANIGWWKIGKIQKSKITVSNNYSAILLVNGVYGNQGQSYNEPSGILEVDVRNNNNTLNQANACVLAGNLTLSNICLALDGAGDLILYHKLSSEYRIATYTLLTENTKSVFELSASFYGTTAPSSAVYAVYANIASKVNNALTLNINGTATVFDGSAAKTVDVTAGGGGDSEAVKYTQQSLTTEQQQQARTNIAAAGSANTVTTDTEQTILGKKTINSDLTINANLQVQSEVRASGLSAIYNSDFGGISINPSPEGHSITATFNDSGDLIGMLLFDNGMFTPSGEPNRLISTMPYYEMDMNDPDYKMVHVYSPNNKPTPADIGAATTEQVNAKYTKPSTGIPKTDLASAVQASLGKADSALQSVPAGYATESYVTNAIAAAVTTALNTAV